MSTYHSIHQSLNKLAVILNNTVTFESLRNGYIIPQHLINTWSNTLIETKNFNTLCWYPYDYAMILKEAYTNQFDFMTINIKQKPNTKLIFYHN